jgi:shikimate kinase
MYFEFAAFFVSLCPLNLRSMSKFFLIGYMGSGKTTYGKLLAKSLDLSFVDLDVLMESQSQKTIAQIFDEIGEDGFRKLERDVLRKTEDMQNVIVATGGGTPCYFDNMEYMNAQGETIYLRTSVRELRDRLKMSKSKRPLIAGKSLRELEEYIAGHLEKRECHYLKSKYILDTDDLNLNNFKARFTELLER